MDERLEKALDFSNYMVTLNNKKRLLKEKYFEELVYFTNGCQFTVTKELVTFVGFLVQTGNDSEIVLTDDNDIPTKIEDLSDFYDEILDVYFTASNNYLVEYEKIKRNRSVEKLIDYEQN
jgi:hypothetical protein